MNPSPDKRQQCSTLGGLIAIKVTISWTLLIRVDNKTMSHWERCFNIAWSIFFYNYIFYTEILCACHQSRSEFTRVWMYDNGWIQAKKTLQSFSQRAVPAPTPLASVAREERAWHTAQNKPAWMFRVWTTEISLFPHFLFPSLWQISPAAH